MKPSPCPLCPSSILTERLFEGILLKGCLSCRGWWLHEEELRLVIETCDRPQAEATLGQKSGPVPAAFQWDRAIHCPECKAEMKAFHFMGDSGVYVEYCPANHGLWIDGDEWQPLLAASARLPEVLEPVRRLEGILR